jgi:D-serine deaminase-like pyridoxal phosphate-dependent protein
LLLTSPVADPLKISRIVKTGAMAVTDHLQQAAWYQEAAIAANTLVDILVDLDVGDHRTGAATLEQAVEIAEFIDRASHLRLRGLQAYSVYGSHGTGREERFRVSLETFARARAVRDAMARKGLSTDILTGGSTGTWDIDTEIPELTELQSGSYVLMDMAYRRAGLDFEHAMTVLATVISANHAACVSIDAGTKAFAADRGYGPEPAQLDDSKKPGLKYRWGGDEFGYLELDGANSLPSLGQKIEMLPPHCDPTANLYDTIYACRGNVVEAVWPLKRL